MVFQTKYCLQLPKKLKQIHAQLLFQTPTLQSSFYLCNSMLLSYAESSNPSDAFAFFDTEMRLLTLNQFTLQLLVKIEEVRKVFDELPQRDVVSFNILIHGYAESDDMDSAFQIFQQVPCPSVVTWNNMVVGYSRNADILAARRVFEEMPDRDLVSWNAMISGYMQNKLAVEALNLFRQMQTENFKQNSVTIATVLSVCASLGALDTGKCVHLYINKNQCPLNPLLGSALIYMYSKCGVVEFSVEGFGNMKEKNTCTWNALINGLAMNGHAEQALDVFNKMRIDRSIRPDKVTFVGVLLACNHGGFIEERKKHFYGSMIEYGITPIVEHCACIVDLLGRSGLLSEAQEVIKSMQNMWTFWVSHINYDCWSP